MAASHKIASSATRVGRLLSKSRIWRSMCAFRDQKLLFFASALNVYNSRDMVDLCQHQFGFGSELLALTRSTGVFFRGALQDEHNTNFSRHQIAG